MDAYMLFSLSFELVAGPPYYLSCAREDPAQAYKVHGELAKITNCTKGPVTRSDIRKIFHQI